MIDQSGMLAAETSTEVPVLPTNRVLYRKAESISE